MGRKKLQELLHPVVPTEVFVTYWSFAAERQNIFFRRIEGNPAPWTEDPILADHRFTNAYRAADRVSQYLIGKVQYNQAWSADEGFFRTLLFKIFNRIETWETLMRELGEPTWRGFSPEKYGRVLDAAMRKGQRIYSAAYIMPSGGLGSPYRRKHSMHLNLLDRMMKEGLPAKMEKAKDMRTAFALLRAYPTIGDFLAYQYATDLNYSPLTAFSETEFVVPGPGAREGLEKCFSQTSGKNAEWILRKVMEVQATAFAALDLKFRDLWGRPLQLIDCQNLFCEVAKYARARHPEYNAASGRTRIKQKFTANGHPLPLFFPPKWALNDRLPVAPRKSGKP